MPKATAIRHAPARPTQIELVESYDVIGENRAPLRIDKDAGIIFGVKLGGLQSKNTHGIPGVTRGTKYKPAAYKGAIPLYENVKVFPKHLERNRPATERGPFESIAVIRNARWDEQTHSPRGDLHYDRHHPHTPQLIEDVERAFGRFGLSHHIPPGGFNGKVVDGWLVVESISKLKSVDLVDDPATTRNLWEGREEIVETTLKALLEKYVAEKTPIRKAIALALIEDDAPAMTAPIPAPDSPADANDTPGDPEDELWAGFMSAIIAILNGDGTAADKAKLIGKYLRAHEKLTQQSEPAADTAADDSYDATPKESRESQEVHQLKAKLACAEAGITNPKPSLVKALALMDTDADRKELIESTRAAMQPARRPTSGAPRPAQRQPATVGAGTNKVPSGDAFRRSIKD